MRKPAVPIYESEFQSMTLYSIWVQVLHNMKSLFFGRTASECMSSISLIFGLLCWLTLSSSYGSSLLLISSLALSLLLSFLLLSNSALKSSNLSSVLSEALNFLAEPGNRSSSWCSSWLSSEFFLFLSLNSLFCHFLFLLSFDSCDLHFFFGFGVVTTPVFDGVLGSATVTGLGVTLVTAFVAFGGEGLAGSLFLLHRLFWQWL